MKTNSLITTRTALATAVAGAVFLFGGCGEGEGTQGTEKTQGTPHADERSRGTHDPTDGANGAMGSSRPTGLIPGVSGAKVGRHDPMPPPVDGAMGSSRPTDGANDASGAMGSSRPTDGMIPDDLARILVEHAVNENDYKSLAKLRDKISQISDPALRMRLLEGLAWFDETAVADSLPFLADDDPKVAAQAGEIVASRISSVEKRQDREKVYTAALKLMAKDSPDREILAATLESDRKLVVMHVLRDLESSKESDPALWKRLTEAYETATGRPYKDYVDALIHYNPRDDR